MIIKNQSWTLSKTSFSPVNVTERTLDPCSCEPDPGLMKRVKHQVLKLLLLKHSVKTERSVLSQTVSGAPVRCVCSPDRSAGLGPPGPGTLQLFHDLQTESFNGPQRDPGPAETGTRTGSRRRVLSVLLIRGLRDRGRFVPVKQGLAPARARARGQHGAEAVGRGHLLHVRKRHGRARRQVSVRGVFRSSGIGAARSSDPRRQQAEPEPGGGRGAEWVPGGTPCRTVIIVVGKQSGAVRGAPVAPRRQQQERTAGWDEEVRDPLRSENQTPQRRSGFNG